MLDQTIKQTSEIDANMAVQMLDEAHGYETIDTEEGLMVIHECHVVLRYNRTTKILMLGFSTPSH